MKKIWKTHIRRRQGQRCMCLGILFCALATIASSAQAFKTLGGFNFANGSAPINITQGFDGSLYGTTSEGGTNYFGTIFKISITGQFTTLYDFCDQYSCTEGFAPSWLVPGSDGNLYGESESSVSGPGAIYRMTPTGTITTLHDFTYAQGEGSGPAGGLVQAPDGNFYGTTRFGGDFQDGSVFKITPAGVLTTLYSFCSQANCSDGEAPSTALLQARDGNFYGTTTARAANGFGTAFKITASGALTTLHSFDNAVEGSLSSALVQGVDGNIYGTTALGGSGPCTLNGIVIGCGTVFKMTPSGSMTVLYGFCSQANCADGYAPVTLLRATDGNFYGATESGGIAGCGISSMGCGTLFRITPAGALTTLHAFSGYPNDGDEPVTLIQVTQGTFYGTTFYGGAHSQGTVFRLSTGLGPFVKLTQNSGSVGQTVGVIGQGFTGATGVFVNGTPASFTLVSDTYMQVTIPSGATTGFITVNTPSGTLRSNLAFRVGP